MNMPLTINFALNPVHALNAMDTQTLINASVLIHCWVSCTIITYTSRCKSPFAFSPWFMNFFYILMKFICNIVYQIKISWCIQGSNHSFLVVVTINLWRKKKNLDNLSSLFPRLQNSNFKPKKKRKKRKRKKEKKNKCLFAK